MTLSAPALLRTALGALALSLSANAMAQTQTLRIQDYPGLGNMIVRVAAANGYCEKNGLKCELKTIPAGPLGIQTLMAGDIDVAFGPAEVVIQAANKGADLKIIGNAARDNIFFLMAGAHTETPNAAKGYPAVMADLKEVYAEAKGNGFDTKIIRTVVRKRKQDRAKRQEEEAILDLYLSAIGEI